MRTAATSARPPGRAAGRVRPVGPPVRGRRRDRRLLVRRDRRSQRRRGPARTPRGRRRPGLGTGRRGPRLVRISRDDHRPPRPRPRRSHPLRVLRGLRPPLHPDRTSGTGPAPSPTAPAPPPTATTSTPSPGRWVPPRSHNQAPLCRRHHRAKTFMRWTYTVLTPGLYLWRSPTGLRYLRSHAGTHELDPPQQSGPPPDPLPETAPPPRWRPLPTRIDPPAAERARRAAPAEPASDPDPPPF